MQGFRWSWAAAEQRSIAVLFNIFLPSDFICSVATFLLQF
jgi:hypothetical protein